MSSGVRNLRAMFEQNAASSPEPRGRSPGSSSAVDDTSRPTSKVRASFVSVEHTLPQPTDFGAIKGTPSNSTAAHRRESFSISEDTTGEVAELKKVISEEREERRKSAAIIEPIPEQAVASRESSVGPPPIKNEPEGDMVNLGTIMKGSDFPEPSADAAAGAPQPKEAPAPELPAVTEEPAKEESALAPVQETPAENPDKATTGAQEEVSLKPAGPTDASAVSGSKTLPPPAEELKPATTEPAAPTPAAPAAPAEPTVETPKPASSSTKPNGTPATKGKLEFKKPATISITKASASKGTPVKSPLPKAAPKTPTNPKHLAATPAPKAATPVSKPTAAAKPAVKPVSKEAAKAAAPKPKTSHTSLRQSTATAPTAAAKGKTVVTENKKPATTKPKDPITTSPPALKKPKPRSPTRPVALNSRLTAPTAASAAKLHGEEAKVTRKPSTATRPVTKPAATKPSRPSVAPSASTNKRPESRTSTVGAKPGFLERMSRPTAASASKVHEKPTSPPRKAPAKSSILQKSKKKVEEVATKAKEAVTSNGHTDEAAKTEPINGTSAHTEASEEPAVEPVTESVPEPVAEKADQFEPVKAETPVPEGESSALELQTPNFRGEAVR
ncbi:hypothetical protein BU25DRAFT_405876 [Macroventuria anomochaeta]|uniref:Uncharacterized protein n=1 Tax=Macroventuria anomochaeta TaxID=301207 RepID=A0ACB6SEZ4_9PLEO|nr:uncharacterized protein BU25DRAFT_405876 [Macroventuria anomochaeta]KAF2632552.1 hypothetical protein BU25DRAFT_405876 [Macroventuria anomochaeta]